MIVMLVRAWDKMPTKYIFIFSKATLSNAQSRLNLISVDCIFGHLGLALVGWAGTRVSL